MKKMKTLALLVVLLLAACNPLKLTQQPGKYYRVYGFGPRLEIAPFTSPIKWRTLGLYAGDYGIYTDTSYTVTGEQLELRTWPLETPIYVDWVTREQVTYGLPIHPFYHSTGGLESDTVYSPPFHIQVKCQYPYRRDILPSVWLLNEEAGQDSTREIDLFETGAQEIIPELWNRPRLWFADHYAGPNYENRLARIVELYAAPRGPAQVDLFVTNTEARRYLNGRLVMVSKLNLGFTYRIRVTLIVNGPKAEPLIWKIDKLSITKN